MTTHPTRRVLYVENGIGYGGAIICLRHLVRNLDRSCYEPMIVTGRNGPEYEGIANESRWKHIRDRYLDIVEWKRRLDEARWPDAVPGLRFVIGQICARLDDIVNFLPFFVRLYWTSARFKPEIIHANNEPLCNRAAVFIGKIQKVPVIQHVRGQQQGSSLMRRMFALPDHFITVSHWVSDSIGEVGVPDRKRTVVYDGIELDKLDTNADGGEFRRRFSVPDDAFAVGLVGLLIPWKGQDVFVDAAKRLSDSIPGLRMLIVGGTPPECAEYERGLRRRVADEGLGDTVIFTGHVTDMPQVYAGLDIVVSASTLPEPLGTVVIESMAMGRPLIGPNHGGAAEMAEHGKTALLFEPGNADDLADCIRRLHDEPDFASEIGRAARAHALQTFAVAEHVRNVQAVYEQVLAECGAVEAPAGRG